LNFSEQKHDEFVKNINEFNNITKQKSRIKIIENNYKKENPKQNNENIDENLPIQITCEHCNSKLEITKDNTHIGWLGARFITCPCCRQEAMIEELDGITLTIDNLEFPVHFLRTNKDERNVKEVDTEEIIKDIKRGIEYFRNNKDEYYWFATYGDLFLIIFRYGGDEEYYIMVTKDFYEIELPFEKADYK
jgi:hypothetical protein